jgi:hydrogenase maturation protease
LGISAARLKPCPFKAVELLMTHPPARCLILACGNTLRGDDGVGLWLAEWAEEQFRSEPRVHVVSRQQWTPELAEEVARAEAVLFVDCSVDSAPGAVQLISVGPAASTEGLATHHVGAAELLALARELYDTAPPKARMLTVGAGSTELGETFSAAVTAALPEACRMLETAVESFLSHPQQD